MGVALSVLASITPHIPAIFHIIFLFSFTECFFSYYLMRKQNYKKKSYYQIYVKKNINFVAYRLKVKNETKSIILSLLI